MIFTASSSQLRVLDRSLSRIGLVALEERSWVALNVVLGVRLSNLYRAISVWAGNPSRSLRASRLGYRELYAIGLSEAYSLTQELINELEWQFFCHCNQLTGTAPQKPQQNP